MMVLECKYVEAAQVETKCNFSYSCLMPYKAAERAGLMRLMCNLLLVFLCSLFFSLCCLKVVLIWTTAEVLAPPKTQLDRMFSIGRCQT